MAIEVKANKDGFYGTSIKREGAKFTIKNEKELGSWMDKIGSKPGPAQIKGA